MQLPPTTRRSGRRRAINRPSIGSSGNRPSRLDNTSRRLAGSPANSVRCGKRLSSWKWPEEGRNHGHRLAAVRRRFARQRESLRAGQLHSKVGEATNWRSWSSRFLSAARLASYVQLTGPAEPSRSRRFLGVMAARAEQVWFVKLQGDAALAEREEADSRRL